MFKISNIYVVLIYCLNMSEMLAFEKIDELHQNLSSRGENEGIFILDRYGTILFANSKAEEIYEIVDDVKKLLTNRRISIKRGTKEIVIYPIFENGELKFFFGVLRNMEEIIKIKKFLDITYERVKNFREDIAHYFFNPILIAKGYLDLLADKDLDMEDKEKIEKAHTAIERIEAVVKNIVINGKIGE